MSKELRKNTLFNLISSSLGVEHAFLATLKLTELTDSCHCSPHSYLGMMTFVMSVLQVMLLSGFKTAYNHNHGYRAAF